MRDWLRCWALAAVPLVALLGIIALAKPRYFWIGDAEVQYAATFHYIGQQLLAGELSWLVPWQGSSANLLLDAQYGLTNPFSWAQSIVISRFDNLQLASFTLFVGYLLLLQGGAIAWLLRLGARGGWAVLGGFAAASGGYVLGSDNFPVLLSLAFLAWLGWALAAQQHSAWHAVAITVTTFGAMASGAPFTTAAAVLLLTAAVVDAYVAGDRRGAVGRLLPALAGALLALPSIVFTAFAFSWTLRQGGSENSALYVPGLADVLNSGSATAGLNMHHFRGSVALGMLVVAGGLGLALLPLVNWPARWWRRPGAITLAATLLTILVLTQGPSDLGPLRWPVRYLGAYQVLLAVGVAAAFGLFGVRTTRGRIGAAFAIWAAFGYVTFARSPQFLPQHLLSIALAGVLVGVVALARPRWAPWGAVGLCFLVMLWAAFGQPPGPRATSWGQPTSVAAYQQPLGTQPERSLVLYPHQMNASAAAQQGVFVGQNYLLGPARAGLGYSSVGQRYSAELMCTAINGATCPEGVDRMLQTEPTTGRQWIELLGVDTITAHRSFVAALREGLPSSWREEQQTTDFVVFRRSADPRLVGRISAMPEQASATAMAVGDTSSTYDIESPGGGPVVFADVYWPGYTAAWNGEPLVVEPLGNALVAVEVPSGAGTLTVEYRPAGTGVAVGAVGAGVLLLAGALIWLRRRPGQPSVPAEPRADTAVST